MVYGQNIRLPGELLTTSTDLDPTDILFKLKNHFKNVRSNLNHHNESHTGVYVPKDLKDCKYVFVRVINKRALQQPYEGPYKVVEKNEKYFKVEISNKITVTPIDRLKPALTENNLHNINTNDINTEQSDKKVTFNIMAVKFSEGE